MTTAHDETPDSGAAGGAVRLDAGTRRSRWSRLLLVLAAAAALFVAVVLLSFGRCMAEQLDWRPTDSARLDVEDIQYAPQGIALTVRSTGQVQSVMRQSASLVPWRAQHVTSGFRARKLRDGVEQVLVEYAFVPKGEWLLALHSDDGFWQAMSPYFSSQPDMDQQAWRDLWDSAERRVPR